MKTLIVTLLCVMMLSLTGCANMQTASVYSNQSTGSQNVINAQGSAAKAAAEANISFNCPSCTEAQQLAITKYLIDSQNAKRNEKPSELEQTISWRFNRALDQALFRLLQDY